MRPRFLRLRTPQWLVLAAILAAAIPVSGCGDPRELIKEIDRGLEKRMYDSANRAEIENSLANPPIPADLTEEQLTAIIVQAAERKQWSIVKTGASALVATYDREMYYMAAVTIHTWTGGYTIRYKDSRNLDYTGDGRTGRILTVYNYRVTELQNAILQALKE